MNESVEIHFIARLCISFLLFLFPLKYVDLRLGSHAIVVGSTFRLSASVFSSSDWLPFFRFSFFRQDANPT